MMYKNVEILLKKFHILKKYMVAWKPIPLIQALKGTKQYYHDYENGSGWKCAQNNVWSICYNLFTNAYTL